MYDDYFVYGGQEIINGPRTKAYLEHMQPTLQLGTTCCECDPLAESLGHAPYSSPAQDDAEWFNPYAPETGGFYGLMPLGAEGFEDSTWTVNITDLMTDGSISGRGRRAGRDLRFKVLAVAESEKAMSRGLAWLREALGTEGCGSGDCGGAQLCYLTDCPACCADDAPEALENVDHLDYRAMTTAEAATAAAADWQHTTSPVTGVVAAGKTYASWPAPRAEITRTLDGLVRGATYRITLDFGGADPLTEITVSVPGAAERLAPRTVDWGYGDTPAPATGVVSWEFIAVECTHRVVISSTADLAVGLFDVSLTNLDSLAYSGQPSSYPSHATPWVAPLVSNATFVVTQPRSGEWHFRAAAGTASIPAGDGEIRTTLNGLVAGRKYRANILTSATLSTGVAVQAQVKVASAAQKVIAKTVTPADDMSGLFGGWTSLEFVATGPSMILLVENVSAVSVGVSTPVLVLAVGSATVEEIAPVVVLPDPNADIRRYLRDVVLTSGPTVTAVYPSYTAVMKEIEWTMRANVPDPLGEDIPVSTTLGAGRWVVPETACSLGEPVRTNYFPNPSGEYGVLGWAVPAGSTITNPTVTDAFSGTKAIRVTQTTANTTDRVINFPSVAVTPGHPWTLTAMVRASQPARKVRARLTFYKGAVVTGFVEKDLTTTTDASVSAWHMLTVSATAPPGSSTMILTLTLLAPGTWLANEFIEFDGVILAREYTRRVFFDGDSLYATWSGTKGNSSSVYQRTSPAKVFDPLCPPPPAPPRPPAIINPCVTTPPNWIRYVLEIPALAVAASPRAAPTITLTTGTTEARGVRVRLYANPSSGPIEEIDPCAFCGEFMIAYLPPSSSLTIDAADKTATIVTKTGEQSALGLLYGSDGGPITWPLLGCTLPYLVALDVDAAAAPLIAASLSVTPIF